MAIPATGTIFIAAILIECYSRYVRALISQRATRYEPVNQMGETFVTITRVHREDTLWRKKTRFQNSIHSRPMDTFHGISRSA